MKKAAPFPITEANIPEVWEYVDNRRRLARKMSAIAKIGNFVANLFFLCILIFFACGLLYGRADSQFQSFWESLFLFPYWEAVQTKLLTPGDSIQSNIVRLVLTAYLVSAAVFLLLAACIHLLYHPFKKKMPEGTYAEHAELLTKWTQEARDASQSTRNPPSIVAIVLAVVIVFVILFAYVFYTGDAQGVEALLSKFPTHDYQVNCLLYVLLLYFLFNAVCSILLLITWPIYRYEFPYDFLVQAELATMCAREDMQSLTPEEQAEQRAANAAKLREEALEMEKQNAYGVAKRMLHQAAICSDVPAMEHYARHCLLGHANTTAKYWLKKAIDSGEASPQAKKMLLRLQLHLQHNVEYVKPEAAPLSTGKKILRALGIVFSTLGKLFVLAILIGLILAAVVLYKVSTDPDFYTELPPAIIELLPDAFIPTE